MARYISKSQRFKKTLRKAKLTLVNTELGPERQEESPPLIGYFQQGGATPAETRIALERFKFKGLGYDENPATRLSVLDTDELAHAQGWTAEEKAEIEELLDNGQGEFYFRVVRERAEKPWGNYDETPAAQIAATATMIGADIGAVLAYERENKNRKSVLEELEKAAESEVVVEA